MAPPPPPAPTDVAAPLVGERPMLGEPANPSGSDRADGTATEAPTRSSPAVASDPPLTLSLRHETVPPVAPPSTERANTAPTRRPPRPGPARGSRTVTRIAAR